MKKEILAEDFMNASREYTAFHEAMMKIFDSDPIMLCLLGNLCRLADNYYMAMMNVYQNGYTLDEILGRTTSRER